MIPYGTHESKSTIFFAPVLMIHLSLLYPLVLGPPVLEPDLDLGLSQIERLCEFEPPRTRNVLVPLVLEFESQGLIGGEGGALAALAGVFAAAAGD